MTMHVTSKGQVTIPRAIREEYGLMPDTEVEFVIAHGLVTLRKLDARKADKVDRFISRLTGSGTARLTTDEILELSRGYADGA
jgi:antitoxin PrlF